MFGPTSKIINNECGGESKVEGEIGGYESRRIKAFRFYTRFFGAPVLSEGEDESTLSCEGLDFRDTEAYTSYYWNWATEGECTCVPVKWAGVFRYASTDSGGQSAIDAEFNNAWNKDWCEELLAKNGGFGGHVGQSKCTRSGKTTTVPATTTQPFTGETTPEPKPKIKCPDHRAWLKKEGDFAVGGKSGLKHPLTCKPPTDPLNKPKSPIEEWFTEEMYNDIFYKVS